MLAAPRHSLARDLRHGFTLLEVLVVVAILIVLASVAGIAVFNYLDQAKVDKAMMDMKALDTAYKAYRIQLEKEGNIVDEQNFNLGVLSPYLESGESAFTDPWGGQYQSRFGQGSSGELRIQFFTINRKNQAEISYPPIK